jgi:signal transduction histidine kinase
VLFRSTVHVEMQKEELKVQTENLMEVNRLLKESREEVIKQKKELQIQSENMQEINTLLREKQEEIMAQSEELELTNNELKKLNATKDKFFSIIAHDLKNPFHAINSFSQLLTQEFNEMDDKKKLEIIHILLETSGSASALLDKLLQWARSQSNNIKINPENLKINELTNDIIMLLNASAEKKNIKLSVDIDNNAVIYTDKNMIQTVLRNLINNAIKFSNKDGEVKISGKNENNKAIISVSDNGVGMDNETLKKIFQLEKYYSSKGTAGEKGTGLGLIICKDFIEKNGGDIVVESEKEKGSTFTVTLPVK